MCVPATLAPAAHVTQVAQGMNLTDECDDAAADGVVFPTDCWDDFDGADLVLEVDDSCVGTGEVDGILAEGVGCLR